MNVNGEMQFHPLCSLFPPMVGTEFDALVADIQANGLREPIIVHEGMILDGGNRYRACLAAGVKPGTMKFGGGNIVNYVLSANLHRRHLTAPQHAAIVASAQDWANAQPHGGARGNQHVAQKRGKVSTDTLATSKDRATLSGASLSTQKRADKVAKADPELSKQVAHGEISLPQAIEKVNGKRPGAQPSKPKPKPEAAAEPSELDDLRSHIQELTATAKELLEENTSMAAILDADDKLAALTADNKKLRELNRVLTERVHGLQGECNEAKRAAKMWRNKFDKLEKTVA